MRDQIKSASAEDGKKTGDRTGVGLFIPLPEDQCEGFPSRGEEDKSPNHTTFLYVGDVSQEREAEFLQVLAEVFLDFNAPVRGVTGPVDYFPQPDKDRRVAYLPIRFDKDLSKLRWKVRDALMSHDFQVDDSFPLIFKPHTTLEYMDGVDSVYVDEVPKVDWNFDGIEVWGLPRLHTISFNKEGKTAQRHVDASNHKQSISLMKFLSEVARKAGVGKHVYVVGGAVRNFLIDQPIKDIDVVIDSVALGGRDSDWFAKKVQKAIPVPASLVTNQYGVAILTVKGEWILDGDSLQGEVIEIANSRKESYGGEAGKGYKPHTVAPATIEEDINRREFTFNTLLWRLHDLANGPDKAEILDLTGCGRSDLQDGWMRCPSSPDKTFSDDPSRMIRAVKFLIKYGFKIDPAVRASIKKNAPKLKNVPGGHLSNMLIETFYEAGTGKKALLEMKKLGLLDVLKEIARKDKGFQKALGNWADRKADVQFLFDLMDLGMPAGKRLTFLDAPQRQRVRELAVQMGASEAASFVALLAQPGKSLDMGSLIEEFGLKGQEIRQVTNLARKILLEDPSLLVRPSRWQGKIQQQMNKAASVEAESFTMNVGDPVLYGKYKNKKGVIKRFEKDEKSGDPIVVVEPSPKGKKQDKEIKLFKIRYDKGRAEADKQAMAMSNNFQHYYKDYVNASVEFQDSIQYGRSQPGWSDDEPRRQAWFLESPWFILIRRGKDLVNAILDKKSVPAGDRKAFEKASRLYLTARRKPRDILKWMYKNDASNKLLRYKCAQWPDKTEGDEKFKLGPFMVHNTIGLEGAELEKVKETIKKATSAIKRLQIPTGLKKVLYGDIYVVARIQKSKTVAWYYHSEDNVYIRRSDGSWDDAGALVHELGHRYLDKFARGPDKADWKMYHNWLLGKNVELEDDSVKLPGVGDQLPLQYKGTKRGYRPVIKEIRGGLYYFDVEDKYGTVYPKTYPVAEVRQFEMQKGKKVQKLRQFPTPYAATNWEEHFCEALGLYAMKKLKGDHVEHFEERWGKRASGPQRVAARYLKAAVEYMGINIKYDDGSPIGDWKIPVASLPLLMGGSPVVNTGPVKVAARWIKQAGFWGVNPDTLEMDPGGPGDNVIGDSHADILDDAIGRLVEEHLRHPEIARPPRIEELDAMWQFSTGTMRRDGDPDLIDRAVANLRAVNDLPENYVVDPYAASAINRVAARWVKSAAAKYKDKKKVKKQDGGEMIVYEYTEGQINHRNREKARRLDKLDSQFPKLKKQVEKDIKAEDEKARQTALAVALINETYERVGNDESASKGHYGVTGWLKKHITISGNSATVKYVGKSGVKHDKKITDKKLVSALKGALKGKGAGDEVFEGVSASDINDYLKPYDITAKDIRGFHANREMREALKKERSKGPILPHARKEKDKILKAEFKKALEVVADTVGHEAATLRSQYLVPGLEDQYTHNGVVPKGQKKAIIALPNATDGREDQPDLRNTAGVLSSLTCFEQAIIQDLMAHGQPIRRTPEGFMLRGHLIESDTRLSAVRELLGAGYLEEDDNEIELSCLFHAKQKLYRNAQVRIARDPRGQPIPDNWDKTPEEYLEKRLQSKLNIYTDPYRYCPVCGQWYSMQTRGIPSEYECKAGHSWVWCKEHDRHVVIDTDARPPREGCRCHVGQPIDRPHPRDAVGALAKAKEHATDDWAEDWLAALTERLKPALRLQRLIERRDPDGIEKWATKTPAEKEDEEAERMVRPAPKLKPPRQDLRRNRMEPDDSDVETEGADKDKDLSKNYKRIAARWLRKLAKEHSPGDVWQTDKGWVGKNPSGNTHTFEDQEKAQAFAKGQGDDVPEKPDKPEDNDEKPDKPEKPDTSDGSGTEEPETPVAKEPPPPPPPPTAQLQNFLENADSNVSSKYKKYNDVAQAAAAEAYQSKWKSLKGRSLSGLSDDLVDEVSSASKRIKRPGQSSESFGEAAAELAFARQVLSNPSAVIEVTGNKEDTETLEERGQKAYQHFAKLDPELRQEAFRQTSEQLTNLPEDSPEREQMTRMLEGLWLASVAAGDDPEIRTVDGNSLVSEPSQMTKSLMKTLKAEDQNVGDMLSVDFYGPAGRQKVRGYMDEMSDGDLTTLFSAGDGELEQMIQKAMSELTEPWQKEMLRGLMRDLSLNTMTSMHAVATAEFEGRRQNGVPKDSDLPVPEDIAESAEMAEDAHRRVKRSPKFRAALSKFQECLADAEDKEACAGLDRAAQLTQIAEMLRVMEEDFGITDPNHPKIVQLRTALKEENPGVLDEKFVAAEGR
jgi:tRNA nucleotidyltransferase/poly(A) polymerase/2'-5' RNA ligase